LFLAPRSPYVVEKHLFVAAEPLLHVPAQWKRNVVLSDQAGSYRYLQLTHQEEQAVIAIDDESLRLGPPRPFRNGIFQSQ